MNVGSSVLEIVYFVLPFTHTYAISLKENETEIDCCSSINSTDCCSDFMRKGEKSRLHFIPLTDAGKDIDNGLIVS